MKRISKKNPKFSVITVVKNDKFGIVKTIKSVINQSYKDFEYLIIDGDSKDGTLKSISKYKNKIDYIISKPDKGLYFAMNKGLMLATGKYLAILNSDDIYKNENCLENVMSLFERENCDIVYSNIEYLDKKNNVTRRWAPSKFKHGSYKYGWSAPHPGFFVKRNLYEKYGFFNTALKIAADFEIMLRFMEHEDVKSSHLDSISVLMLNNGLSSKLKNRVISFFEVLKAFRLNKIECRGSYLVFYKYIKKFDQFLIVSKQLDKLKHCRKMKFF